MVRSRRFEAFSNDGWLFLGSAVLHGHARAADQLILHNSDPKSYEKTDQDLMTVIKGMTVTILWTGRDLPTYPERLE